MYVEHDPAVAKFKKLQQEGYFKNKSDVNVCGAINQPGFKKFLHIKLLRDVSTARFISEMSKDLVRHVFCTIESAMLHMPQVLLDT